MINVDHRKCPTCGATVSNHQSKGQKRKGGCPLTRGQLVAKLAQPQPFKVSLPNRATLEAQLRKLPREKLESKLTELTSRKS